MRAIDIMYKNMGIEPSKMRIFIYQYGHNTPDVQFIGMIFVSDSQIRNKWRRGRKLDMSSLMLYGFTLGDGIKSELDRQAAECVKKGKAKHVSLKGYNLRVPGHRLRFSGRSYSEINWEDYDSVDLSDCNLSYFDFSNKTLRNVDFSNVDMDQADFSNARLINCNMNNVKMTNCNFSNAQVYLTNTKKIRGWKNNFSNSTWHSDGRSITTIMFHLWFCKKKNMKVIREIDQLL